MAANYHAIGVYVGVPNLDASVEFFGSVLSMPVRVAGAGWATVDNGSISLRLVEGRAAAEPVEVELTTRDIAETTAELCALPGVQVISRSAWPHPGRQEQRLSTPHGVTLVVARDYDEDELGVVPPLPSSLPWDDVAVQTAQELLANIPVSFRPNARKEVTSHSEYLTVQAGDVVVTETVAIRAVIQLTPALKLGALRAALAARGLDPSQWEADFER
jgi:hypothetical protein